MGKRVVIVGSSFAGLTAALSLRERLPRRHEVVVVAERAEFVFLPSLLSAPFGLRRPQDLSFPLAPLFEEKGVVFRNESATALDLERCTIATPSGPISYDYLVLATGTKLDFAAVPGLGPDGGFTESVFTVEHAERARAAFERFVRDPGPVVIGTLPGSTAELASYLLLLEMARQLELHGLSLRAPLTYLTPEPVLRDPIPALAGIPGKLTEFLFKRLGVRTQVAAVVREVTREELLVEDGRRIPFKYAILAPPCRGSDLVRGADDLADPRGFVVVDDHYRAPTHPHVFAAGAAVSTEAPGELPTRGAVVQGPGRSEEMARVVAAEIAAELALEDGEPVDLGASPEDEPSAPHFAAHLASSLHVGLPFGAVSGLASAWW